MEYLFSNSKEKKMNLDFIRNEFRFNARASAIIYNMDDLILLVPFLLKFAIIEKV